MITDPLLTPPALLDAMGDPARAIAAAVVLQAVHDLRGSGYLRARARRFIASAEFATWCNAADFDAEYWRHLLRLPLLRLSPDRIKALQHLRGRRVKLRKQIAKVDLVKQSARLDSLREIENQIAAIVGGEDRGFDGESKKVCQNKTKQDTTH